MGHPHPTSALPPFYFFFLKKKEKIVRSTSIDFAENQLSPSSIGFSPLIISHLRLLPQTWVRSSKTYYRFFNLLMTRSLGFGSSKWYFISINIISLKIKKIHALFKLVFTPPPLISLGLLHLLTRWPIMQKVRRHFFLIKKRIKLRLLVYIRFQDSFSLPF